MKNLKRVLSMALASVMLVGTMVVGASAVDFTDGEEITHTEAVNTMVSLNIINGKDDGSFDPEGTVTRAEMAKMIATAMNGGVEPNFGTKPTPSFTDIKGHWAESFIEYCYSMKIISGRGNGIFDPAGNVTGVEAAKMVLTALGYDAEAFQLMGAEWDTNVNYQATWTCNPSLYEGLNGVNLFQPLTRDNAAQLIWNGVQNKTVIRTPDKTLGTGEIVYSYDISGEKLVTLKYGALIEYAYLEDVTNYDEDKGEYTYDVDTTGISTDAFAHASIKLDQDLSDLYLKKVKVVYKPNKNNTGVATVYGVFAQDSSTVFSGVVGNVPNTLTGSDKKIKISGTTYNLDNTIASTPVYEVLNGEYKVATAAQNLDDLSNKPAIAHYNMDLIDKDGNGKADTVIIYPFTVAQVTAVGKTSISAGTSYKRDEANIYDGIAKDDWVKVTPADNTADGKTLIEEIELTTGTVDALKKSDGKVEVDGTWYTDADGASNSYTLNDEYNLVIVNGYVFNAEAVDATVNVADAVFVLKADDAAESTDVNSGTQTVRLLFTDGSKKNVTVVDIDGDEPVKTTTQVAPGETYIYAINDDGDYELTSVKNSEFDAIKGGSTAINVKNGKATAGANVQDGAGTFRFNDDAVVFVANNDLSKVSVLTGEDINAWGDTTYTTTGDAKSALYAKTSNGFDNVVLGSLVLTVTSVPGAAGNTVYGWLTSDSARVKKGTTNYLQMNIWNGEEEITVLAKTAAGSDLTSITSSTPNDFTAGTVIGYTVSGDYITNVNKLADDTDDYFEGAVKAYKEGGEDIEFANDSTIYTITDDTAIIFVDSETNEGYDTGAIQIADIDNGTEINNVIYYYDHNDAKHELKVIFVDMNNELK